MHINHYKNTIANDYRILLESPHFFFWREISGRFRIFKKFITIFDNDKNIENNLIFEGMD